MEHVPAATSVMLEPLTVQTVVVADEKDTGRPELAVALEATEYGPEPRTLFTRVEKVIVWEAWVIAKLCITGAAAR